MKFIDLSIPIVNPEEAIFDPPISGPHIEYRDHNIGAEEMGYYFARLKMFICPEEHLPDGKGWATETVTIGTHCGIHMDAPWHFAPIQDKELSERKAMTIDNFPLEWGIGPLIVIDCTDYEEGYVMTPYDIDNKLKDIGHKLREGDILCVHTNAPKYAGSNEYFLHGVGVGKEATLHIIRQGVHIVGIDAWSWDAPFYLTAKKWKKNQIPQLYGKGIMQDEN